MEININKKVKMIKSIPNARFHKWGKKPVLYDESHLTWFCYRDEKWMPIDRHTAEDDADEITDDEIKLLFTPEIIKRYNSYIDSRYNFTGESKRPVSKVFHG